MFRGCFLVLYPTYKCMMLVHFRASVSVSMAAFFVQLLAEARSGMDAWRASMQLDDALARRTVFRLVR